MSLLAQLALSTVMVIITVIIHTLGISILARMLRRNLHHQELDHHHHITPSAMAWTVFVVLALFVVHGIEIWLYAGVYYAIGALGTFEDALYFSTYTYSTVGYSDDILHPGFRILSAIEGINGFLLLGWSTAFFLTIIARLRR